MFDIAGNNRAIATDRVDVTKIRMPKNLRLADPVFDKPNTIDLLIGAGLYWKILVGTPKNRDPGHPAFQNTRLGWIVGGEIPGPRDNSSRTHLAITNDMLNSQLERFWRQEEIPETIQYTEEEKYCEKHFEETVQQDMDGRFVVRLPQRSEVHLGESKEQALRRLLSLERRFTKDSKLREGYVNFMDDYLKKNHMSLSQNIETQEAECCVLPHQAVVRQESVTTKLRVVFDASAKTTVGTSLNDRLMPGPNLQRELVDIILRFRTHPYVITADIAMMYRQILVNEKDRALQRILWRRDPSEPVQLYDLNTVTYGTSCAPYLAMRCLRELAAVSQDLPQAARAVNADFYMDDVLTGARTIEEATELQRQLSELLLRGQFQLRKWRSNEARILQNLAEGSKTDELLILDKEEAVKTLGLLWNAAEDCLQYHVEIETTETTTKRIVLSKISQIFDPLGLITPLLITGKIIVQRLWLLGTDWDEMLPDEPREAWENHYASLPRINELRVPRNVVHAHSNGKFEIFGFGDASEKAYGACLCAVSIDEEGRKHSHLICSKAKVAPLKTISLPRLELEAALLLSNLFATVEKAYGESIEAVKLWSDSTIVLGWINTQPNVLKTFVANRISKIQNITSKATWNHVPSEDNPADMLSRGITIDRLIGDELWWHGPKWIREKNPWPMDMKNPETALPELKL
ncbi:PREDICTED: uncharacterized protein LOC105571229 [Vollenhovia emeryi]|uniref:uncharacterized protein LOC105571229 n=1 Tax=Vollenhovia emeryi TaxID=411798 RepID=UPI0005F46380|nr:PREDICTED: uncharacterized protein LOC105571229 [Vollenhovia emeryi]